MRIACDVISGLWNPGNVASREPEQRRSDFRRQKMAALGRILFFPLMSMPNRCLDSLKRRTQWVVEPGATQHTVFSVWRGNTRTPHRKSHRPRQPALLTALEEWSFRAAFWSGPDGDCAFESRNRSCMTAADGGDEFLQRFLATPNRSRVFGRRDSDVEVRVSSSARCEVAAGCGSGKLGGASARQASQNRCGSGKAVDRPIWIRGTEARTRPPVHRRRSRGVFALATLILRPPRDTVLSGIAERIPTAFASRSATIWLTDDQHRAT